jgi:hypothetical protein
MLKTIIICVLVPPVALFGILIVIDWLFKKYPDRMFKIFSKLNPQYDLAVKALNKHHYDNGTKAGFDYAYFQLQEICVNAFAKHEPTGPEVYSTFKEIMVENEALLRKFYPNINLDGISSKEIFQAVEDGGPVKTKPHGNNGGSNLLN